MLKVIAFDVFGTVFDLSSVDREEVRAYARHLKAFRETGEWLPLTLPKSWETLPAHADSREGIRLLSREFTVVTCSNGPIGMLKALSEHNGIKWDRIIPLELNRVYKPDPRAYLTVCEYLECEPHEVAMVTANKDFGDLEASAAVGMRPILIRNPGCPQTVIELAELLTGELK